MIRSILATAALLVLASCGVHRQLVIDSDPPGARVFMDREDIGTTPIRMDYEYGGVRQFVLLHEEGKVKYRPVRVVQDTGSFFLDQFPFDVLARVAPVRTEEEIALAVKLEPSTLADEVMAGEEEYVKSLMERAEIMRERARRAQDEGEPEAPPFLPPMEKKDESGAAESRP